MVWPKKATYWTVDKTLYISVPFTWDLPDVRRSIGFFKRVVIGGPAVKLMPGYFKNCENVEIRDSHPGVLQTINPMATKTTTGCIRSCPFCAVPYTEGKLIELADWPDKPVLIDNNLLAASTEHFDRVIDRLVKWKWADFNQGLDARLLNEHHAQRLAEIKKPLIRLALDNIRYVDQWQAAFDKLRSAGIAKKNIRSYALVGFDSDPSEAWQRCKWIEGHGIKVLPQWFHRLDAMEKNKVTPDQQDLGWNDYERRRIMQWFYQHKKAVK